MTDFKENLNIANTKLSKSLVVAKKTKVLGDIGNIPLSSRLSVQGLPILVCDKFQEAIWIGFGCVTVGSTSEQYFQITNPDNRNPADVKVDKFPSDKGFTLSLEDGNEQHLLIPANTSIKARLIWKPTTNLTVRDEASIKINNSFRLFITLHGVSGIGEVCTCYHLYL